MIFLDYFYTFIYSLPRSAANQTIKDLRDVGIMFFAFLLDLLQLLYKVTLELLCYFTILSTILLLVVSEICILSINSSDKRSIMLLLCYIIAFCVDILQIVADFPHLCRYSLSAAYSNLSSHLLRVRDSFLLVIHLSKCYK